MNKPKPQVTRIAAYGIVIDSDHILLCRLSDYLAHAGMWTLPGGGLEFGEHPEAGMVREVEEETGLIVRPAGVAGVDSIAREGLEDDFHAIRIIYHTRKVDGELRHEIDGTTDMCQWHPLDDLDALELVDLVEVALRLARDPSLS